ncbi:UPF0481 protein At3g47200-like [Typha angustifolia]|uniref:UPF0481 protein At3g47200-like n=1 Tax=Typha angustifolia TaxID=59011 RepID=UPI003C2FC2D3
MAGTEAAADIENVKNTDVIEVEALLSCMSRRLDALPETDPLTIFRVPAYIRERNKRLYEPMWTAIGPHHHGKEHLQAMEKRKWWYLRDLLSRSTTTSNANLGGLLGKMKTMEEEARRCYGENITLGSDEFVEMMVLDACLIIELFLRCHNRDGRLYRAGWGMKFLQMDLLLLENQIPFFVIEGLFELVVGGAESREMPSLIQLLYTYLMSRTAEEESEPHPPTPPQIHHILHLYYLWSLFPMDPGMHMPENHPALLERLISLLFSCFPSEKSERSRQVTYVIPCATELRKAGARFRVKRSPRHMLDVTFRNGVMEIPLVLITDLNEATFTNLVAFEQSIREDWWYVTSFFLLMNSLINSEKDVAILRQCGVMDNFLGSEEEVALFFNQLGDYATFYPEEHFFSDLFREVNRYRDSRWHRYRTTLARDYFGNPWAILSLVAALILLAFTFLQTFFTIYAYFPPRK